jgi:hypothetical protein
MQFINLLLPRLLGPLVLDEEALARQYDLYRRILPRDRLTRAALEINLNWWQEREGNEYDPWDEEERLDDDELRTLCW